MKCGRKRGVKTPRHPGPSCQSFVIQFVDSCSLIADWDYTVVPLPLTEQLELEHLEWVTLRLHAFDWIKNRRNIYRVDPDPKKEESGEICIE